MMELTALLLVIHHRVLILDVTVIGVILITRFFPVVSMKIIFGKLWNNCNSETIKKMTTSTGGSCRHNCFGTDNCRGFVWTKDGKDCELKGGDVKISVDKAGTVSGVMPCPWYQLMVYLKYNWLFLKSLALAQSPKSKSKGEASGQSISLNLVYTHTTTPPPQTFRTLLRHLGG